MRLIYQNVRRVRQAKTAKMMTLPANIAMFALAFLYICSKKANELAAITAPITKAVHIRVWLNHT